MVPSGATAGPSVRPLLSFAWRVWSNSSFAPSGMIGFSADCSAVAATVRHRQQMREAGTIRDVTFKLNPPFRSSLVRNQLLAPVKTSVNVLAFTAIQPWQTVQASLAPTGVAGRYVLQNLELVDT